MAFGPPVKDRRRSRKIDLTGRIDDEMSVHETDIGRAVIDVGGGLIRYAVGQGDRGVYRNQIATIPTGSDIDIVAGGSAGGAPGADVCAPGYHVAVDKCTGQLVCKKNRRRRKKMLTCSDKADIAFIIGQLGKGAGAQSAISAMLAKCG